MSFHPGHGGGPGDYGGPSWPKKPDCGCGGSGNKCGGTCGACCIPPNRLPPAKDPPIGWVPPDPGYKHGDPCMPISPGGVPRGSVPLLFNLPAACYDCACVDPCLYPAYLFARQNFDPWQWARSWENEGELVHIDVPVGAAPDFNVPALPIGANSSSLFAQEARQVLPFIPGLVKVNVKWSNGEAPSAVRLQFYTGPNPTLTGVTAAQLNAATASGPFALAGQEFKLTDFECGDSCYVQEFPRIFKCTPGAIPYTRALYVRVTTDALPGNTTISSLDITILKQGTRQYANCCNDYRFKVLGPKSGGCCGDVYRGDKDVSPMIWGSMLGLNY